MLIRLLLSHTTIGIQLLSSQARYRPSRVCSCIRSLPPAAALTGVCVVESASRTACLLAELASQLRIQSILSPADPPDADETSATNSTPTGSTPNRKFNDAFAAPVSGEPPSVLPAGSVIAPRIYTNDRFPNSRQPLPQSSPLATGGGGLRRHGQTPDNVNKVLMVSATMRPTPESPASPGLPDLKRGAKRTPLRSSIACQRCRKSKIKCNNTGGDAPCDTCIRNGKQCIYPDVAPAPPKRTEPPTGVKSEQGSERKRPRRLDDIAKLESAVPPAAFAEEVLTAPYLTESVWSEIFDLYKLHFATELPFLHLATLKEKMGNRFRAKQSDTSPEINLVLLGVLTLTVRFNPTLVSYVTTLRTASTVSSGPKSRQLGISSDATTASEFYADVLTKALGGLRASMTMASVERVQAFLMLGLYEWGQARPKVGGMAAWMYVGMAIRMAQALGLGDGDKEDSKTFKSRPLDTLRLSMSKSQLIIAKEIRRRTMFSCLILDRLLGCGKGRASTVRSEDLRIQLPCSEMSFDLSEDVYTGFLNPTAQEMARGPISDSADSVLSRFIRLVDIWGEISKWSFAGGRFTEQHAPWKRETTFYQLRMKLETFYSELPERFCWSRSNYYKHENHHASSVYVSLHMLGAVCKIMLHREYIPFIAIRCKKPVGPLDEPTFAEGDEPTGFWNESAEEIFRAAKDIVDLIDISQQKLPMSTLVLFAVWTAAFVGIYAVYFPHIDVERHMLLPPDEDSGVELEEIKKGPTGLTYKTLQQMGKWLKMADTYVQYFHDMVRYYDTVKKDYEAAAKAADGPGGEAKINIRLLGGGLEEWKYQGLKVVNNGEILAVDDDRHSISRDSTLEPASSRHDGHHTDHHTKTPRSTSLSFTPINTTTHHHQHPSLDSPADTTQTPDGENISWHHPPYQRPVTGGMLSSSSQHQSPSQSSFTALSPHLATVKQVLGPPPPPAAAVSGSGAAASISTLPNIPVYNSSSEVMQYIQENQSIPWNQLPGGVDHFAHGTDDFCFDETGNGFWGSMPVVMGASTAAHGYVPQPIVGVSGQQGTGWSGLM
ncbi:hypothetical protein GE21DRAFT_6481 [Neurospora crassa]|uniref:Uncharacterized protein n=1 Tax=Neurospora crassa (strain ATCC 24698 / 74-OR23-1A / CBS 708.71 / DSM 1257 / FGSC 987) TaxID=367110 RepID=Q7SAG0_NEUCR|nr:hypothetical protein NCU06990 [Neurospora crassa OR74A]EAA33394.3 hypothetical protein NCU06990 [Neurospora crassa OR74A]KHE79344.1 hypothetical protein GE21DRAFT_6481 [Neurospora crassa]|eukprot:XP_962630.3 hypothetical protein NCU06990 [Neurospora crassa OR74A]